MPFCPFCDPKVLSEQVVYETDTEYVIYNIRDTKCIGRCVVVPKEHISNIRGLSQKAAGSLFETVWFVATKINEHYKPVAINYGINEGKLAGQTVDHLHVHIIPRYQGDGLSEFHLFHEDHTKVGNLENDELIKRTKELRNALKD